MVQIRRQSVFLGAVRLEDKERCMVVSSGELYGAQKVPVVNDFVDHVHLVR